MNWEEMRKEMEATFERMKAKDAGAKANGQLTGRYLDFGVADGRAYYEITRENKQTVTVKHLTGLGDDYQDWHLGAGGSLSKAKAEAILSYRDRLDALFAAKGK